MNNKLRLRTKVELEDRKKGFLEIVNILKSNNRTSFRGGKGGARKRKGKEA